MKRDIIEPTVDEHGEERHPAYVLLGASRVSSSPPGHALFDSDIRHQHYVVVRLKRASRKRDLGHDWTRGCDLLFEVAMSEAQWASFVSSMNTGDGVPATLEWDATQDDPQVPRVPYAPRLAESMEEVHAAAENALADIREAFEAYKAHPTKAGLRDLEIRLQNATPNMDFAAKSLSEHAENVVTRARADIEAYVVQKAKHLGIEPGDLGSPLELTAGKEEE